MRELYILEAKWHDKIGRVRYNEIIGVYNNSKSIENAKQQVLLRPHNYKSISFGVNIETQPFHA